MIKKRLVAKARALQERYPNAFLKKYGYVSDVAISDYSFESMRYSKLIKICFESAEDWVREEQIAKEEKEQIRKHQQEEAEAKRVIARAEEVERLKQEEAERAILVEKEKTYHAIQSACPKGLQYYLSKNPSATIDDIMSNKRIIAEAEVRRSHIRCSWLDALEPNVPYRSWKKSFVDKWTAYIHLNNHDLDNVSTLAPITFSSFGHNLLSYYSDCELEYPYLPEITEGHKYFDDILKNRITFIEGVYDSVLPYGKGVWQDRMVVFCGNQNNIEYHFKYIREQLEQNGVPYCHITDEDLIKQTTAEQITVFELISTKEGCRKSIELLRNLTNKRIKSICYYSFVLELSSDIIADWEDRAIIDVQDKLRLIDGQFIELGFFLPSDNVEPVKIGNDYRDYLLSDILKEKSGFVKFIRLRYEEGVSAFMKIGTKVNGEYALAFLGIIKGSRNFDPRSEEERLAISGRMLFEDLVLRFFINEKGALTEPEWVVAYSKKYDDIGQVVIDLTNNS